MRIHQMSDLHLEFEAFLPSGGADMLMLNGDICVADRLNRTSDSKYFPSAELFREFFKFARDNYEHVLYIPGNHEHYEGRFDKTVPTLLREFPEITILNDSFVDIKGIRFIGTTLWTNLNNNNPITENYLRGAMNDYKLVKYFDGSNYRKLMPGDTYRLHLKAVEFINQAAEGQERVVVMSHHAPSERSVHPKYANDIHMNGGYFSNLENFILDIPQIKLWSHGHTHDCYDYEIGTTRIVCNPKGYRDENKYFNPEKVLEL